MKTTKKQIIQAFEQNWNFEYINQDFTDGFNLSLSDKIARVFLGIHISEKDFIEKTAEALLDFAILGNYGYDIYLNNLDDIIALLPPTLQKNYK